jgi:hypothetical protein
MTNGGLLHKAGDRRRWIPVFRLGIGLRRWAMLVSNQRPLPCECEALVPLVFAGVQKLPQNGIFDERNLCGPSPPFAWVGVLLV